MTKQNKTKIVFSMRIASQLIKMGHQVIETLPNPAKPNLTMWVFEENDTFEEDFRKLQGGRKS